MTDNVSFRDIAATFAKATGKPAFHASIPLEAYASVAEHYPGASFNWALGPDAAQDDSIMSWLENFGARWHYWGDGITKARDKTMLDRIHPQCIKSLADWITHVGYDGRSVLKAVEDWSIKIGVSLQERIKIFSFLGTYKYKEFFPSSMTFCGQFLGLCGIACTEML